MDRKKKISRLLVMMMSVICMLLLHPITASAEEKLPGGVNNVVSIRSTDINMYGAKTIMALDVKVKNDYEMVGWLLHQSDRIQLQVSFCKDGVLSDQVYANAVEDLSGFKQSWTTSGAPGGSSVFTASSFDHIYPYQALSDYWEKYECTAVGLKIFYDRDAVNAYVESGSLDGLLKDEYASDWYLKDIRLKVTADDSPASESGEDATYIQFNWLTDNLQEGDLLEIRTHNYLKKIGGDQISGMHDFITWSNNVSAYDDVFTDKDGNERASYTMSQYDATKAWFSTLENKPLIFKSYDTDIYYLRPYRNGVYGRWCKVTIGRSPLIKGTPYIEDIVIGDLDDDGEFTEDEDLTEENGGHHGSDQGGNVTYPDPDNPFEGTNVVGIFASFFDFMKNIPSLLGELPALVYSVIGFLPSQVIGFIGIGIVVVIILRIVGR